MAVIRLLDSATINKIAAGEVVERPASIVKELVENAIDAEASAITVEIRDGGISYIRVTDNGNGISADQVRTAFLRHSTSKIGSAEDLASIASLGFRGEALASIAAVCRVEVLTRTPSAMTGIRYVIEGGEEKRLEEIACPVGTTFKVENLFFNTPVRKKFLKKPVTEASYVTDFMQRIVMGHPEISFQYLKGGHEPLIHSPGNNTMKNSVYAVYGKDLLQQLLPLQVKGEIQIEGYISKPQMTRANRTYENYYLNGRYIRSKVIERALEDAYKDYIVPGTYPIVILQITMDPSLLDVNVHPTKMEVRFTEEERVGQAVYEAVLNCLRGTDLTAQVRDLPKVAIPAHDSRLAAVQETPVPEPRVQQASMVAASEAASSEADLEAIRKKRETLLYKRNEQVALESETPALRETTAKKQESVVNLQQTAILQEEPSVYGRKTEVPDSLRLVGQIFRTYWIAEDRDVMYMIDQHAAHERVLYDRLKEKLANGVLDSQILLEPMIVTLPPKDYVRVMEQRSVFERLGYALEEFGESTVLIREVPYIFNATLGKQDFQTMVDLLQDGSHAADQEILIDRMAMVSCKAAVKGNDAISFEEMESLMKQLMASPNPFNCPHGRPTMMTMTQSEWERRFKR